MAYCFIFQVKWIKCHLSIMLGVGVYQHHDDNKVTPSTGDHSGNEITVINLWIILLIGCLFISQDEKRCVSNNFGNIDLALEVCSSYLLM